MRTRDLEPNDTTHANQNTMPPTAAGSDADAEEVRRGARRLLDLGDAAISQALSQDSATFLAQNRQQGGQ